MADIFQTVDSALSSLNSLSGSSYPLPNVLSSYPTYNYILGLGVLTKDELENPDTTYMKGKPITLICKSAGSDPNNRVNTKFGKFDFFVERLTLDSVIAFSGSRNTNVTKFEFDVVEPYSLGLFMLAVQQAAFDAGFQNWRSAPFIFTIEFRGNTQAGTMLNIPGTTRYIPFKWGDLSVKATEAGTKYTCSASAWTTQAQTTRNAEMPSDTAVQGKTVQEVLQTGENSLQAIVNRRLKQYKEDKIVDVPDEILILFPKDKSSSSSTGAGASIESTATATINTTTGMPGTGTGIEKKLGVTRSTESGNLIQSNSTINEIGASDMGFNLERKADAPISNENVVYNTESNVYVRGDNNADPKLGNFKFSQDTDIIAAINQVLLSSDYAKKAMDDANVDAETGMRKLWIIDPQVYVIDPNANLSQTGTPPLLRVYRIMPYGVHPSKSAPPNTKVKGLDSIKKNIAKQYDYIYTGKNTEVLQFDLDFKIAFSTPMPADNFRRSQDSQLLEKWGVGDLVPSGIGGRIISFLESLFSGGNPLKTLGTDPTQVEYSKTRNATDGNGGGGLDTAAHTATRHFFDAATSALDMKVLNLQILGDPYWISQSGVGNYSAVGTSNKDVNSDKTVDHQSSEVDVLVEFKTPIDIKQSTGMYDFGGGGTFYPVIQFSGLYQVTNVVSEFRQGRFTQTLKGNRRPQQENPKETALSSVVKFFTDLFA